MQEQKASVRKGSQEGRNEGRKKKIPKCRFGMYLDFRS